MSFWETNSAIIREQYPGLLEAITQEDNSDLNDMRIEAAASGVPTLAMGGLYVHSPRDPQREARRLVETCLANTPAGEKPGPVVVLGFGLGYAAEAAASIAADSLMPIIIVEKRPALLRKAFELRDFSGLLSRPGIAFMPGGSGEGISAILSLFEKSGFCAPCVIRNRTLTGLDEQWYTAVEGRIRNWAMKDDVNAATLKKFGGRWIGNLIRNMSAIRDLPGISRLEGLAVAKNSSEPLPVFLAAAGPGLDSVAPLLPQIRERCIIVAVDTSLRFLLRHGITPDFVLVVDPQFWNSRHLDCMYREEFHTKNAEAQRTQRKNKVGCVSFTNDTQPLLSSLSASVPPCDVLSSTILIAESAVYPPVLRLPFKGAYLCGSLFPLGAFVEQRVDSKGALGAGGSVATSAWDFARLLGTRQIWIAGLDLAFPGLKTHYRGAQFEEKALAESNRFCPAETWLVHALRDGFPFLAPALGNAPGGEQVLTDRRLSLYAAWFESRFRQFPAIRNYSLSGGGLAIAGLELAETQEFLALPERRAEINQRLETAFSHVETDFSSAEEARQRGERYEKAVSALYTGLRQIQNACEKGKKTAAEALRQSLKHSPNPANREKTLAALDEINRHITGSAVKEIAGFLLPPEILAEMGNTAPVGNANAADAAFRSYLESSLKLYNSLADSLPHF